MTDEHEDQLDMYAIHTDDPEITRLREEFDELNGRRKRGTYIDISASDDLEALRKQFNARMNSFFPEELIRCVLQSLTISGKKSVYISIDFNACCPVGQDPFAKRQRKFYD